MTVTEANNPPVIDPIGPFDPIEEGTFFTFEAHASDPDDPPNGIAYFLSGSPAGMGINPATGVVTWTPSEIQGPGTYTFSVVVADDASPSLSSIRDVTVTVTEVNRAPSLAPIGPFGPVPPGQNVSFAPAGAAINPANGAFSWIPSEGQAGATYTFKVKVTDNGEPPKSAEVTVVITVS